MQANDPRLLQPGELVRITYNQAMTFDLHANRPGIYLGTCKQTGLHTVFLSACRSAGSPTDMLSALKVYFAEIEGNFEKVD